MSCMPGKRVVCWRLQQEDGGSTFTEGQKGTKLVNFKQKRPQNWRFSRWALLFKLKRTFILVFLFFIFLVVLWGLLGFPAFLGLICSCRTALFSFDTVRPRAAGSRTPSPCSTRTRSTTFPSASWRSSEGMPWEKRERRMRRWKEKKKNGGI